MLKPTEHPHIFTEKTSEQRRVIITFMCVHRYSQATALIYAISLTLGLARYFHGLQQTTYKSDLNFNLGCINILLQLLICLCSYVHPILNVNLLDCNLTILRHRLWLIRLQLHDFLHLCFPNKLIYMLLDIDFYKTLLCANYTPLVWQDINDLY